MPNVDNRAAGLWTGVEGVWGFGGTARYGSLFSGDQRVLYVSPNYPTATDLGNTGEDPLFPFATVGAALGRCRDCMGDTIFVSDNDGWKYGGGGGAVNRPPIREEITVAVEGVRIIGVSSGYGVTWEPVTPMGLGTCITLHALNVLLEGFAFQGGSAGGRGIYGIWGGPNYGENFVIRNCSFDEDMDIGIQAEFAWFWEVSNCIFLHCDDYGIYVDPAGSGVSYARVHHNVFHNCGRAIGFRGADNCWVGHNVVYNGLAQDGQAATDKGIDTAGGGDNTVFENWFSCILPAAAPGDYNDLNSSAGTDAWIHNHCLNGNTVTNPT